MLMRVETETHLVGTQSNGFEELSKGFLKLRAMAGGKEKGVWATGGMGRWTLTQRTVDNCIRECVWSEKRSWDRALEALRCENKRRSWGRRGGETG